MTLQQWSEKYDRKIDVTPTGATSVLLPSKAPACCDLFHLSDYAVSTVSGPVAWLVRRVTK